MARAKKQDGVQLEYRDSYRDMMTSIKKRKRKNGRNKWFTQSVEISGQVITVDQKLVLLTL